LTVGEQSRTQELRIKLDPRVKTPPAQLTRQFKLASDIAQAMTKDFSALEEVRSFHEQAQAALARAGSGNSAGALAALEAKLDALMGEKEDFFTPPTFGERQHNFSRLSQDLQRLLELVDGADLPPTRAMESSFSQLRAALDSLLQKWNEVRHRDLPLANEELRRTGLTPIGPSSAPK